jgi:hypothetical protein
MSHVLWLKCGGVSNNDGTDTDLYDILTGHCPLCGTNIKTALNLSPVFFVPLHSRC